MYKNIIKESWAKISPCWPLKNFIAVNPLQGMENLPFEKALEEGIVFFEQKDMPKQMELVNRITIKWLQAFFDEGQACIGMPLIKNGLYESIKKLLYFDDQLHKNNDVDKKWLENLSSSPQDTIAACLAKLKILREDETLFLTLMLTTLPGWASYIKYRIYWTEQEERNQQPVSEDDYLAIRLIITCIAWQQAADLIVWHKNIKNQKSQAHNVLELIKKREDEYLTDILKNFSAKKITKNSTYDAQVVFCIDVRSEPLRKQLENTGNYETFGFAGFFGVPVRLHNTTTNESYAACPVLLQPTTTVNEVPSVFQDECKKDQIGYQKLITLKSFYQSFAYNFTTSLVLIDFLGLATGLWMMLKTLRPLEALLLRNKITNKIRPSFSFIPLLENIPFADQCLYAQSSLQLMGLTKNFSPLVLFCGHGSSTQNNAYASALDCGACAGNHGGKNAQILAEILNCQNVRAYLAQKEIIIPESTYFIAGEHNTTCDEIEVYKTKTDDARLKQKIKNLQKDLNASGKANNKSRSENLELHDNKNLNSINTKIRSVDWAQVRPEWGLACNASFVIGPRHMTDHVDLRGRSFLHSYDYFQDTDGLLLTTILTAPVIVAQWINSQYLFSTIDNIAYGSGSKITKNITGKFGVMQGNASDLMTGLPLQSVYASDLQPFHIPVRLMVIVHAPCSFIDKIIQSQPKLQTLFGNGWVMLVSIDPNSSDQHYFLNRDLTWEKKY